MHIRRETHAQATVEMALVLPVLLVMALIVFNLMMFVAASARFDRVAPDIVIAHGVSPVSGEAGQTLSAQDEIAQKLQDAMEGYDVEIEVVRDGAEENGTVGTSLSMIGSLCSYTCTMRYRPWPSSFSIAGVDMGAPLVLTHEREVTIDTWKSGVIM